MDTLQISDSSREMCSQISTLLLHLALVTKRLPEILDENLISAKNGIENEVEITQEMKEILATKFIDSLEGKELMKSIAGDIVSTKDKRSIVALIAHFLETE
ncbi:MAG: hypothetical protein RL641_865 [Candidatus Parcubacteria bacterium]|jgi:hypothetical protein